MVLQRKKRNSRCVELGERIILCNGVKVVTPDYNYSCNIGKGKVQCSCTAIVLYDGYNLHIKRPSCLKYHETTKTTPKIINHLC